MSHAPLFPVSPLAVLTTVLWYLALGLLVAGYVQWFRALAQLSAEGRARHAEITLLSQFFAGRAAFTPAGWRLRTQAVPCVALALLCAGVALVVGGLPFTPAAAA